MSRNSKEHPSFIDRIRFWLFAMIFPVHIFTASIAYIFAAWVLNPIIPSTAYWVQKYFLVDVLSYALGLSSELREGEKLKSAPKGVIVMNHQSMWDLGAGAFQLMAGYVGGGVKQTADGPPRFNWIWLGTFINVLSKPFAVVLSIYSQLGDTIHTVSKSEVFYYWPLGYAMHLSGSLFIDRKNPKAALESLTSMSKKIFSPSNPLRSKVIMFPEGTRNPKIGGDLLPFKRGAFKVAQACNVPVIPMVCSPHNFMKSFQYLRQGKVIIRCLDPVMIDPNAELDPQIQSIKCSMQREYTKLTNELGITPEK